MRKRILAAIIAAAAIVPPASALTLDEARALAEERYPLLKDYDLLGLTEKYDVENAAKAWLPQVTLGAQATWQTDVVSYPAALTNILEQTGLKIEGIDKFQYKLQAEVRQAIWDGGRIKARQDIARSKTQESRLSNDVELYRLRSNIEGLFFGTLLLAKQEEALKESAKLLEANLEKMRSLVANGAVMQSDADAIEVELISVRQQLVGVEATAAEYRNVMAIYVGDRALTESYELPAELTVGAASDSSMRPEQQLMNARLSLLDAKEKMIKTEVMPQIGAFAQGFFGYPGLNFMEAMMNRNPGFGAIVGVSASWNIGSLYTKSNKLAGIQASRDRIRVARDVFDFNVRVQASRQRGEIIRLEEISRSDDEIVELRRRIRVASEARLREGVSDPTELLLRLTEERNAIIAKNTHYIQLLQAQYQLQHTLNN